MTAGKIIIRIMLAMVMILAETNKIVRNPNRHIVVAIITLSLPPYFPPSYISNQTQHLRHSIVRTTLKPSSVAAKFAGNSNQNTPKSDFFF